MSYCRWSTDNFRSDVYVYAASSGGWTTHVAGRKRIGDRPTDPYDPQIFLTMDFKDPVQVAEWEQRKAAHDKWLEAADWHDVPEPYGGTSYNDDTPQECAARLRTMKAAGIYVPDGVIEELDETPGT